MTDRIEEIRGRVSKATPLPWFFWNEQPFRLEAGEDFETIALIYSKDNLDFIQHARDDVPFLLDDNAALRARVQELEKKLDEANADSKRMYSLARWGDRSILNNAEYRDKWLKWHEQRLPLTPPAEG